MIQGQMTQAEGTERQRSCNPKKHDGKKWNEAKGGCEVMRE